MMFYVINQRLYGRGLIRAKTQEIWEKLVDMTAWGSRREANITWARILGCIRKTLEKF